MKVCANLAFERSSLISDNSSKFIISDVLGNPLDIASWSKKRLLDTLAVHVVKNLLFEKVLRHAVIKIQGFNNAQLGNYLQSFTSHTNKAKRDNFYSSWISKNSTSASNAYLLLPELKDIRGIYVNVGAVSGVDQAMQVKAVLEAKQKSAAIQQYNPAILYIPIKYTSDTLHHAG